MVVPAKFLFVFSFFLHFNVAVINGCADDTEQFRVNCSVPEASGGNVGTVMSHIKGRCSQISVPLVPLVSAIWLCPTKVCDGCLYVQRSTEVVKDKTVPKGDNPVQGDDLEQEAKGGFLNGSYILSINYWNNGVKSTIWLSNLFTPVFSESFIPLPADDTGNYITVDGIHQEGNFPITYAVCVILHPQSPCLPDRNETVSSPSPTADEESSTFSTLNTDVSTTTSTTSSPNADVNTISSTISSLNTDVDMTRLPNEDEDDISPELSGFTAGIVVLSVLLVLALVILTVLLLHRRHLLKWEHSADVLNRTFMRSESSEQMVASLPNNRGTSFSNSLFNAVCVTNTGSLRTDAEDTASGFTAASDSVSQSGGNGTFYIDIVNPEGVLKSPEIDCVPRESSRLNGNVTAVYDTLASPSTGIKRCSTRLYGNWSNDADQNKKTKDEDGYENPVSKQ